MSTHEKDSAGFYRLAQLDDIPEDDMLQVPMEDDGVELEVALGRRIVVRLVLRPLGRVEGRGYDTIGRIADKVIRRGVGI